jgi:mRNA interferase RelE/StbE
MKVEFDKSFSKSIVKLKNKRIKEQLRIFIEALEKAESLYELTSIKMLKGDNISYRKKIGSYRVGFEYEHNLITMIVVAHRKDIYKSFP